MNRLEQEIEFLKQNAEAGKTPGFKIGRAVAYAVFLFIIYAGLRAAFDAPWLPAPKGFQYSSLYFELLNYLVWGMVALFPIGLFVGRKYFFDFEETKGAILIGRIWFGVLVSVFTLLSVFMAFLVKDGILHWTRDLASAPKNEYAIQAFMGTMALTFIGSAILIMLANAWLIIGEIVRKPWLRYFAAGAYFSAPISAFLFDAIWYPWLIFIILFGAVPAVSLSLNQKKLEA